MKAISQDALFYQSLGRLFYAIAASDKKVHETEIKTLKRIAKKIWTQDMDQIEFIFDWLSKNDEDPFICFNDFVTYKKDHEKGFTLSIKKLIWETANLISNAVSGKNKSELILLSKLKLNLQE